jgi:hypothetical protein
MEPIPRKAAATASTTAQQEPAEAHKTAPSKFDRLRADLNQQFMSAGQLSPKVVSITDQQKQMLSNDLQRKLASGKSPQEIVGDQMNQLRGGITNVRRQVSAVPDVTAFATLRERLKSIESDFNASAKLLDGNVSLNDHGKLLEMQMQMYKMTENVEVLSRTVSEVGSGVKTILQTQV